ncbi:MAG: ABC transporter permease, partial [Clostridia bacterium]|nr:ABC transporter permease [Clostridia bacterium]
MKNRCFSGRIMNQGLRLLLLPGLILGLTTMALSVLQTVSQAAPYLINIDQTILSPPIALTLFAWCGPIVLALCAFGFLRKRRASDVYHSVPVNRTCLYFSYTVAVIIWVFATILLTTVARDTVFIIAGGDFYAGSGNSTVMTLHLLQTCGLLLSTLKPLAVTLLVMAMSGTLVANLALTAILLYLPGIAGMFYRDALSSAVGWVYPMSYSGSSMLWGFGRPLSVRNELLSLAIALIYGFLGWLLFIKRRSEAAGPGAPASPVLHAICRIGVTLPFITYIPVMFLNNNWDQGAFIGLLVLALLAFVAYFTYELITTRRFISMLKAAPVFLVVAGLALGGGYALVGAKTFILNFRPKADDVRVVCINPAGRDKIGYVSHGSYNDQLAGEVWVNNTKAKTILCEALGGMLDNQPSDVYAEYTPVRTFETIFRTRFLNRRRNIRLTLDKYNELMVICCETSQEFKDAMIAMPKDSEITQYRLEGIPHENYEKIHEEAKEIFQIYREECKGLDLEKLLKLRDAERLYSDKYNGIYGPLIINVNGQSAKGYYYQAYHVTREETPETYEKMMALGSGERSSALAEALVNAKDTGLIVSFTGFTKWFNFH